ncbi:MAG TPA: allantoate amidohydrolase, partial [Pseudonocardiaceae bacterium]|nr:allantoate amidohydrolase [Pseudonocardiaceae bacterium]
MSTLLDQIADVGRDGRRGGYSRHGFDRVEAELRIWFAEQARRRGLDVRTDRNGN